MEYGYILEKKGFLDLYSYYYVEGRNSYEKSSKNEASVFNLEEATKRMNTLNRKYGEKYHLIRVDITI